MGNDGVAPWRELPLAEVCVQITSGGTPLRKHAERYYNDNGLPWVKTKELQDRSIYDTEEHLTNDALEESAAKRFPTETILMAMYASPTVGRLGILKVPAACNQACAALLVDRQKAHPRYVFYALLATRGRLQQIATGSAQQNINARVVREHSIPVPSLDEQEAIASTLGGLDDKIESNRRLTTMLEQLGAALFRQRFVHFAGRDDLVASDLGPIPRGWTVAPIGHTLRIVGGGTPSTKELAYWEGGTHCWATPKDLAGLQAPILLDTQRHLTDAGIARISSRLLPSRTVLLSSRAPIGYTAISEVEVAVNQGFIAIPPSDEIPSEYVLFWLRENLERIKAHAGGTTFAEISKKAFRPLLMLVPPRDVLGEFENHVRPMIEHIASCEREIHTLAEIRDALLPKLISGTIRVGAEHPSETVAA